MRQAGEGVLVKLAPNQDVTHALQKACRAAGFSAARVRSAVGSLVEGVVSPTPGAQPVHVEGPALEVAGLYGEITAGPDETESRLHGYLCTTNGEVVEGWLAPGRNPIAVTFEVVLEPSPGTEAAALER